MSPHCCRPVRFYAQHPPVDASPSETKPRQEQKQLSKPFVPQAKNKTSGVDAFAQRKTKAKTPLFCWRQRKTAYIDILLLPSQKNVKGKRQMPLPFSFGVFFLYRKKWLRHTLTMLLSNLWTQYRLMRPDQTDRNSWSMWYRFRLYFYGDPLCEYLSHGKRNGITIPDNKSKMISRTSKKIIAAWRY